MIHFIPSKEFTKSKQFYLDLGFSKNWEAANLCEMRIGEFRFLLQDFYCKENAENSMVHMVVDNAEEWYQKFFKCISIEKYPEVKVSAPQKQE